MFFSLKTDNKTRGNEATLVKDQCRLDIMKCSFSQRKINYWNTLSTDCVTASSVNMFKNKFRERPGSGRLNYQTGTMEEQLWT